MIFCIPILIIMTAIDARRSDMPLDTATISRATNKGITAWEIYFRNSFAQHYGKFHGQRQNI